MNELLKLYWTNRKRWKIGIISLNKKGIKIFKTSRMLLIGNPNLREELFADIPFKEIIHITYEIGIFKGKRINLFVTKETYEKIKRKGNKLEQFLIEKLNTENKLTFYTMSDSKDEIILFINRINELKNNI
ncbi:MAG: hypothetical protein WC755_06390 [Candidatus Woesearchaeota archaeon]|jgi:hypothetical protein